MNVNWQNGTLTHQTQGFSGLTIPRAMAVGFFTFFTVFSRTNGVFLGTFHGFFTVFHGVNVDRLTKTDFTCFHVFHVVSRFFMFFHVFSRQTQV
jgi:hypothetical protein